MNSGKLLFSLFVSFVVGMAFLILVLCYAMLYLSLMLVGWHPYAPVAALGTVVCFLVLTGVTYKLLPED